MSVNTPRRDGRHVPLRDAHGKLACDSLLQNAVLSFFFSFSPSSSHVFHSHPPLLPPTPPTCHPDSRLLFIFYLFFNEYDVTLRFARIAVCCCSLERLNGNYAPLYSTSSFQNVMISSFLLLRVTVSETSLPLFFHQ